MFAQSQKLLNHNKKYKPNTMKKNNLILAFAMFLTTAFYAQVTTITNYNFNAVSAYAIQPSATASNVTCSGTSSEPFQTFTGAASGSGAFTPNTTAGNAIAMANSSGTNTRYFLFQLGGVDLNLYQSYKLYFQPQRSSTGANLITVAYSTDGNSYTNFSTTYAVSTSFSDISVDLSSITALNNTSAVYIKLLVAGATATAGTIRIDNFQVQANKTGSSGGGSNPWTVSGNNVGFAGNVGIGVSNPSAPLDVNGNTNINGNITTTATKNITAGGNIIGNSNLTIAGTSTFNGDVTTAANKNITAGGNIIDNGNLTVAGTSNFNGDVTTAATKTLIAGGDVIAQSKLTVAGDATFNGALNLTQGLNFDANNGFKLQSVTTGSTTSNVFVVGKQVGATLPFLGTCPVPFNGSWFLNNGGGFISAINGQASPYQNVNSSIKMYTGPWNGDGFIEVEGTDANGTQNNVLALNYFCGRDILLNTGPTPGKVIVGNFLSARQHVEIGDPIYGIASNNAPATNVALDIHANVGIGIKFKTYNNALPLLSVENPNSPGKSPFTVLGDGRTYIGELTQATGPHNDARLTVNGKMVAKSCYIRIADWADYVFAKDYKLPNIYDIEKYYLANKHLPEIPSEKEVIENGIDIAEMNKLLLKKIEEMTIFMVKQQKEIDALKEKIK
jgi:hypothetical protein